MSFLKEKRRKQLKKCTRGVLEAFKNYQLCITTALSTELELYNSMLRTTNLRMRVGNSTEIQEAYSAHVIGLGKQGKHHLGSH